MLKRLRVVVHGVVQGVGFRPFVYRLARSLSLFGFVLNDSCGVRIEIEGTFENISAFVKTLTEHPPPRAIIQNIFQETLPIVHDKEFKIHYSEKGKERSVLISPDIGVCHECVAELFDPFDRRYLYPFINCTNCGPRFTIISDTPYDRAQTSMRVFTMCPLCQSEFDDPENRRFHAQPNACHTCGPRVRLLDKSGKEASNNDPLSKAASYLRSGKILALKGLGGFHFACDAKNNDVVSRLRSLKHREDKPFALMAPDIKSISPHAFFSLAEEAILNDPASPIVILKKTPGSQIAASVAPRQKTLGFMLPYTPIHYILLKLFGGILVMTSGNVSDEPIAFKNSDAFARLSLIADFILDHDREILTRCDDSIVRVIESRSLMIRRSRGFAPFPVSVLPPFERPILALGGEMKNTFCLGIEAQAFMSHHIGDLENFETFKSFEEGIEHFQKVLSIKPELLACDAHPRYLSSQYAEMRGHLPVVKVQHHHAHIVSCMAEHKIGEPVIGIAFDGSGLGDDQCVWGGEILIATLGKFNRFAHLLYVPLPGGEKAIREPWRMAIAWLFQAMGNDMENLDLPLLRRFPIDSVLFQKKMIQQKIACPLTSSIGRLFDAVAAILDIRDCNQYEGQAAIELEMASLEQECKPYLYNLIPAAPGFPIQIDFCPTVIQIAQDYCKGVLKDQIGGRFHQTVAAAVQEICCLASESSGIRKVVFSGGVFQNVILVTLLSRALKKSGFEVFSNEKVPSNDGGFSLGQAVIANAKLFSRF